MWQSKHSNQKAFIKLKKNLTNRLLMEILYLRHSDNLSDDVWGE